MRAIYWKPDCANWPTYKHRIIYVGRPRILLAFRWNRVFLAKRDRSDLPGIGSYYGGKSSQTLAILWFLKTDYIQCDITPPTRISFLLTLIELVPLWHMVMAALSYYCSLFTVLPTVWIRYLHSCYLYVAQFVCWILSTIISVCLQSNKALRTLRDSTFIQPSLILYYVLLIILYTLVL